MQGEAEALEPPLLLQKLFEVAARAVGAGDGRPCKLVLEFNGDGGYRRGWLNPLEPPLTPARLRELERDPRP